MFLFCLLQCLCDVELYQSHLCLCSHGITSLISHADTANIDTSNKDQSLRKGSIGLTDPVDIIMAISVHESHASPHK